MPVSAGFKYWFVNKHTLCHQPAKIRIFLKRNVSSGPCFQVFMVSCTKKEHVRSLNSL